MAFGIALSVRSRVRTCTPALFDQVVDGEQTARVCAEIKDALEMVKRGEMCREDFETFKAEQKKRLAIFTPHATFPKGRRVNEDAVPSGLSMYDIDHIPNPRGYFQTMVNDRVGELGIVLAHITPSTEGLRLFFVMPEGMNLEEAQRWMSEQLGDEHYDGCVKDLARCSFVVPRDYILYLDEEELFTDELRRPKVEVVAKGEEEVFTIDHSPLNIEHSSDVPTNGQSFKGIPYSSIISEWFRRNGGEPQTGERNVKLHKLAVNLRAICDNKKDLLLAIMPKYGLSETELKSIIDSACKENPKGVSKMMTSIIDDLSLTIDHDGDEEIDDDSNNGHAATYADQVNVRYCDGMEQRLGLMSIILGDQASGKSVCKNVVDIWKRQLDEDDAIARKREEEWKERKKSRKANEKAPEDPKVLIRVLPVTVSCSTLLKRFKNSCDHTLYSFGEELDTLRKTNGAGSWSSKYDIYRLSFDRGEWGQDYNSDQAESGVVKVAYNWTMLGTYGAMRKCFKSDNIENGLSSRILVAEMPDSSFAKMPKYGKRTLEDEAKIQEAVNVLRRSNGMIDTPRLRKAIEQWVEEKRVEAAKDIDRVKDTYRKRAAVIGFRCGVIFHLLTGKAKETQQCIDFALMMAEYCLNVQIKTFGESLSNQYENNKTTKQRNSRNKSVFEQLPPTFSTEDVRALKDSDCNIPAIRMIISRWVHDSWIKKIDNNLWQKCNR